MAIERLQKRVEDRVTEKAMRRLQPAIDEMAKLQKEIKILVIPVVELNKNIERLNKNIERFLMETRK